MASKNCSFTGITRTMEMITTGRYTHLFRVPLGLNGFRMDYRNSIKTKLFNNPESIKASINSVLTKLNWQATIAGSKWKSLVWPVKHLILIILYVIQNKDSAKHVKPRSGYGGFLNLGWRRRKKAWSMSARPDAPSIMI